MTYGASRIRDTAGDRGIGSTSRDLYEATTVGRPTLVSKNSTVLALRSSAFSWNPYGVSTIATVAGSLNRSSSALWTLAIVGAVSPEPMIDRIRSALMRRNRRGSRDA